jgi:hypothetical protein
VGIATGAQEGYVGPGLFLDAAPAADTNKLDRGTDTQDGIEEETNGVR